MFVPRLCNFCYNKLGYGHTMYSHLRGIPVPMRGFMYMLRAPFFMRLRNISDFKLGRI